MIGGRSQLGFRFENMGFYIDGLVQSRVQKTRKWDEMGTLLYPLNATHGKFFVLQGIRMLELHRACLVYSKGTVSEIEQLHFSPH